MSLFVHDAIGSSSNMNFEKKEETATVYYFMGGNQLVVKSKSRYT